MPLTEIGPGSRRRRCVCHRIAEPHILLRKWDGDVVLSEDPVNDKTQIASQIINGKIIERPEMELKIQRGISEFRKSDERFGVFQNLWMFFGGLQKKVFHQFRIRAVGYAY